MNLSFENKVVLVTGAGSGIGLATAKAFAEAGASVALADWNETAVQAATEKLAAKGHKALAIHCDVADDAQVEVMVHQTVTAFGRLDAAYNNAGVQNILAETVDQTREDFDRVIAVNLRGVWSCMRSELRQMRQQGSGAIVNCFLDRGIGRRCWTWNLSRCQAWSDWTYQKRGFGIRREGHSDQRCMSWTHRYGDVRPNEGCWSSQCLRSDVERSSYWSAWSCGGDCRCCSVAVQFRCKLSSRSGTRGRWWIHGAMRANLENKL